MVSIWFAQLLQNILRSTELHLTVDCRGLITDCKDLCQKQHYYNVSFIHTHIYIASISLPSGVNFGYVKLYSLEIDHH